MLDTFIDQHRDEIQELARRSRAGVDPLPSDFEPTAGLISFLEQLVSALREPRSMAPAAHGELNASAARHGHDLGRHGYSVGQVVHNYGALCQSITELAIRLGASISVEEFKTLNLCLDDAIAGAVTEYSSVRERDLAAQGTERLGVLAHELRNLVNAATLSFDAIVAGHVTATGSTGRIHARSLMRLRDLVDQSLADVRLDAAIVRREPVAVASLVREVVVVAKLQAMSKQINFVVAWQGPAVDVAGDRPILIATIANLLDNAFKFTPAGGQVSLTVRSTPLHVVFEVADACGGLPSEATSGLFRSFTQHGTDRSGLGLGLSICLRAARAHGGDLGVENHPGRGCTFILQLPLLAPATHSPSVYVADGSAGVDSDGSTEVEARSQPIVDDRGSSRQP
jgi:signal transduction histidine kinase